MLSKITCRVFLNGYMFLCNVLETFTDLHVALPIESVKIAKPVSPHR